MNVTESTKVKQNPNMLTTEMDGEIVMMSITHGKYFSIGKTGVAIWEQMATERTIGEVVDQLCERYEVERGTCAQDVIRFVEKMASNEIVLTQ
ncbi:lasso peptide biosynthesis PqqD family chaperone [Exiguobacterium algae]|uniref:lasso peptide biosynthesis PqqD family chaperone n=1 Tax=Exiguobacterium algae TaxID=2751250 RepID=UPI001BE572E9|nr:lasso peptide biosynthesis PqqD family chaperone [Exiguobacterium algae]